MKNQDQPVLQLRKIDVPAETYDPAHPFLCDKPLAPAKRAILPARSKRDEIRHQREKVSVQS